MPQEVTRGAIEWMKEQSPPHVVVQRYGRWMYSLKLLHGLIGIRDGLVFGERHAERVARRWLRRYEAKTAREEAYGRRIFTSEPRDGEG